MNSCKVKILVSCCFVAAVGVTVYWMGTNSGRKGEQLNLIRKAEAADDKVTDPNGAAPRPDADYPGSESSPAPDQSRESEYTDLILSRRDDTNDIEAVWRSKLIKEQDLTEKDF